MTDLLDFLFTVLGGVLIGLAIQQVRYKHSLRIDKIRRLAPYLEQVSPILDRLSEDCAYGAATRSRDNVEVDETLQKLANGLDEYHAWFLQYQQNGLQPELRSLNENLFAHLNGLFVYAQLTRQHGKSYIHQRLPEFNGYLIKCKSHLDHFLMG